jgi:hypothetical protein
VSLWSSLLRSAASFRCNARGAVLLLEEIAA